MWRPAIKNDLYPLLKLAIPLALTGMVQSSVFFFETLFLARVGTDILAAGALVNWLFATLVVILLGTLSSINILVSHKYGAKDHNGISLVVRDGLFLAILLAIPAFIVVWNASSIFLLFGQSPAIVLLAKAYLHALAWGILPNFIMIAFLEFIVGLGHIRIIIIFNVLSVSINIFFSFALIFGKFGMPALGIAGAGWGTTISYWVTVVILATYVLTHKYYRNYLHQIFNFSKPSFLMELLQVGVPMGAMYCVEVAFFFVLALVMGSLGSHLLAANQIAMQYLGTLMGVIFSIAQAITVRMGHLLGAKELNSAKHAGYAGIFISAAFMGIISIFYWFFPLVLISIDFDIHNPNNLEIVRDITMLFAISGVFQILEAMRISLFAALRALKDTHFTLLISIISFWCIALPIGYLLATYFQLGGQGLWYGMVMGATFSVLLLYWRFKSKMRRYNPHEFVTAEKS
jgi:MATE family multidrug resistance protein